MSRSPKIYLEVAKRLGPRALAYRSVRAIGLKSGFSVWKRPIQSTTNALITGSCPSSQEWNEEFPDWWSKQQSLLFSQQPQEYQKLAKQWFTEKDIEALRSTAINASRGKILAFRAWEADYGFPVNWARDPVTQNSWPNRTHSMKIAHQPRNHELRDIKYVWEISRFLHLADVIRYLYLSADLGVKRTMIEQIRSFEADNPIHQGVHWISEQEVAIRVCMFTRLLFALNSLDMLEAQDAALLMRQIFAGAEFCYQENGFARRCISNNHYLAGALGMYLPAVLFPWHKNANRWKRRGRRDIIESLNHWNEEGGYIQPAHNYHRLALNYLIHAKLLADSDRDTSLSTSIATTMANSEKFLYEFLDLATGMLPNWGPNDGAQFCCWTKCPYQDFRPAIKAAQCVLYGSSPINHGAWDEYLFWTIQQQPGQSVTPRSQSTDKAFRQSGLQIIRHPDTTQFGVLRTGPITSRYGQQADLLHFDLFYKGQNILIDAGSYAYGESHYHKWFRSSRAHNTISIEGYDQMVPYSKFLYVYWPHSIVEAPPTLARDQLFSVSASHDGFQRIHPNLKHTRSIALHKCGYFIILDSLSSDQSVKHSASLRWHLPKVRHTLSGSNVLIHTDKVSYQLKWACNTNFETSKYEGSDVPIAGWHARNYGRKSPSIEISISAKIVKNLQFITVAGPHHLTKDLQVTFDNDQFCVNGEMSE